MKILIIEDELPAAEHLKKMITSIDPHHEIIDLLGSYCSALAWLQTHSSPDLILMDIDLGDGLSIDLFKQCRINCPVIFITAYDQYWQQAFELNGIAYLLKPVQEQRLRAALIKLNDLQTFFNSKLETFTSEEHLPKKNKERFLVKRGNNYFSILTDDVAYFYAAHKITVLVDKESAKYILDESVTEIQKQIDDGAFFRINRKYLVNKKSVKRIQGLPKTKLTIELVPAVTEELIISAENNAAFKKWMNQ